MGSAVLVVPTAGSDCRPGRVPCARGIRRAPSTRSPQRRHGRPCARPGRSAAGICSVPAPVEPASLARAPALPHRWLHSLARRYLNPWMLSLGLAGGRGSPIGLVLNVGRRTGRLYATPLAVHRRADRCFVPLTYGSNARWCLNVLAADGCRVRIRGREYAGTDPRVVGRGALPPRLRAAYWLIGMREFLVLTLHEPSTRALITGPDTGTECATARTTMSTARGDTSGRRPRSGR